MVCILKRKGSDLKRLLLLGFLSYLVYLTVDFSGPEFQPIRTHVDLSLDHVKSHKYYNDYIIPAKNQLKPFIVDVNDKYIQPSYSKFNIVVVDKYQIYLSKHVDNVVGKVVQSPAYAKIISYKPLLVQCYSLAEAKVKCANRCASKYTLIGVNKIWNKTTELKTIACELFQNTKPLVIDFYNERAIPYTKKSQAKASKSLGIAKAHAIEYFKLIRSCTCATYRQYVVPFYQDKVIPLIQPKYDQYLKKYVDAAIVQAIKFYNLLKVEKIISLSQKCYSSAYKQIINYGKTKTLDILNKSTVATADSATDFEGNTQVPKVVVTPTYSASDEDVSPVPETEGTPEETPEQVIADKAQEADAPVPESTASEPVYDEGVEYGEFDEDDDYEETITKTIARTVTQTVDDFTSSSSASSEDSLETKVDENGEIILTLTDEITAWRTFIDATVENIFRNYDKSLAALEKEKIAEAQPEITSLLQALSMNATSDYQYVNRVIYDVNSTTTTLENGEVVEIDAEGKLIDHKISRQEFRDLLAEKREVLKVIADKINEELKKTVKEVEAELEVERRFITDIFEEFAEVAINEFSKKMMYSTFSNSFRKINQEGLEDDDENFSDWREYVKAKNFLIKKREELIQKELELETVNGFLKDVAFTLKTLEQESGNGFAILRAKANLAFQFREAKERREALEAEEAFKAKEAALEAPVIEDETVEDVKVDIPVKSYATLSISEIPEQETESSTPAESVIPLSKNFESHSARVDAPLRSFASLEEIETEAAVEEDLVNAVEEAAGIEFEPAEPVGGVQQPIIDAIYESMDESHFVEAEATAEAEVETEEEIVEEMVGETEEAIEEYAEEATDQEIFEHSPDAEDSETDEEIVEHKPDSAE